MLFEMEVVTEFLKTLKEMKVGQKQAFKFGEEMFIIKRAIDFYEIDAQYESDIKTFVEFSNAIFGWNIRMVEK